MTNFCVFLTKYACVLMGFVIVSTYAQFTLPTSGLLKYWSTWEQISLTSGHHCFWLQQISELFQKHWQTPPLNTLRWGVRFPFIASLHFLPPGYWLPQWWWMSCFCNSCHVHTCQWSNYRNVYTYCGTTFAFNENFALALLLSALE